MAILVNAQYTTQAVASSHAIIEGRAVMITSVDSENNLPIVEYPDHFDPTHIWIAMMPSDTFTLPVQHELYTAPPVATYRITDPSIYAEPASVVDEWLVPHSTLRAPIIHRYEKVALVRGLIGITEECYQENPDLYIPGCLLALGPNGTFRKVDNSHPISVAHTVYYHSTTGTLYINTI